ncbi:MAG: hypothetical protein ABSC71_06275 [Candidatus Acidiferrales bacterium]|jgi:hypothetical protein
MSETESAETPRAHIHNIKRLKPKQRACDELNEKGKRCFGNIKRWYDYPKEVEALVGEKKEIYRCEFCKTVYTPDLSEAPNSFTLRY